uniref:Uncharacterized protein n=1 Tax=Dryococelus australis TaxID=614101 RepID=A0ABQ9GFL0_9NEOP|nr:hypothetical protein PR048_028918 [Dryococelus australis]
MPLVGGFYRGSPPPRTFHTGAVPYSPHFTRIGSQDHDYDETVEYGLVRRDSGIRTSTRQWNTGQYDEKAQLVVAMVMACLNNRYWPMEPSLGRIFFSTSSRPSKMDQGAFKNTDVPTAIIRLFVTFRFYIEDWTLRGGREGCALIRKMSGAEHLFSGAGLHSGPEAVLPPRRNKNHLSAANREGIGHGLCLRTIPAFAQSDFEKPWKTEIRMTGPGIEPGSSRISVLPLRHLARFHWRVNKVIRPRQR